MFSTRLVIGETVETTRSMFGLPGGESSAPRSFEQAMRASAATESTAEIE